MINFLQFFQHPNFRLYESRHNFRCDSFTCSIIKNFHMFSNLHLLLIIQIHFLKLHSFKVFTYLFKKKIWYIFFSFFYKFRKRGWYFHKKSNIIKHAFIYTHYLIEEYTIIFIAIMYSFLVNVQVFNLKLFWKYNSVRQRGKLFSLFLYIYIFFCIHLKLQEISQDYYYYLLKQFKCMCVCIHNI